MQYVRVKLLITLFCIDEPFAEVKLDKKNTDLRLPKIRYILKNNQV